MDPISNLFFKTVFPKSRLDNRLGYGEPTEAVATVLGITLVEKGKLCNGKALFPSCVFLENSLKHIS